MVVESSEGTKTRKSRHPGNLRLERPGEGGEGLLMLELLPDYAQAMAANGTPVEHWLFMPCAGSRSGKFKKEAYNSGALCRRLVLHLQREGIWVGQTLHGIRRGSAQEVHNGGAGESLEAIARKRLWANPETVATYVHSTRHLERVVRRAAPEANG